MTTAMLAIMLVAPLAPAGQELPRALRAFEEQRRSIVSGSIEWEFEDAENLPDRVFPFVARYAMNGDRILEARGDQDGWVAWNAREKEPVHKFPQKYMRNASGVWQHAESTIDCDWWRSAVPTPGRQLPPGPDEFFDIRALGMMGDDESWRERSFNAIWCVGFAGPDVPELAVSYREERSGDKWIVTGSRADGASVRWTIDPDRGWNAELIELRDANGRAFGEVRCGVKEFGDTWFPATVEVRRNGTVRQRYRVKEALINRADDPPASSGSDLGLEVGFNIQPKDTDTTAPVGPLFWDGRAVCDLESLRTRIRTGQIAYGPTTLRVQRSNGPTSPYLTGEQRATWERHHKEMIFRNEQRRPLSQWELYVAEASERFKFDAEQRQKAQAILAECRQDGAAYLARKKSAFYDAQANLEQARSTADAVRANRAASALEALRAPIDQIFEMRLKPRIDALPTRAQRKHAETTTQPTTTTRG